MKRIVTLMAAIGLLATASGCTSMSEASTELPNGEKVVLATGKRADPVGDEPTMAQAFRFRPVKRVGPNGQTSTDWELVEKTDPRLKFSPGFLKAVPAAATRRGLDALGQAVREPLYKEKNSHRSSRSIKVGPVSGGDAAGGKGGRGGTAFGGHSESGSGAELDTFLENEVWNKNSTSSEAGATAKPSARSEAGSSSQ